MKKVFIDTSCYLAIFIRSEEKNQLVTRKLKEYINHHYQFFTSYYVLNELYTRIVYDFGKVALKTVIAKLNLAIKNNELKILDIDEVMFSKSTETMIKFAEHKLSFVDATIFNLVKSYNLDEVFTLDSDFKKVGLNVSFL